MRDMQIILEIMNLTNCCALLFFEKYALEKYANALFQFCESVRQILKTSKVTCFSFHVLYPYYCF